MMTAMETNNRTNIATEFINEAAGHITGFFKDVMQVHILLESLLKNGFDESDVTFLGPTDAVNAMDMAGEHHGIYGRLLRNSQKFFRTPDFDLINKANEELDRGHYILNIVTMNDEEKSIVSRLMKQYGGFDMKCSHLASAL